MGRLCRAQWALAGLAGLVLLGFGRSGGSHPGSAPLGVYLTILLLGACAGASYLMGSRVNSVRKWAATQLGLDVLAVTSLVYFSGNLEAGFVLLYPVVALYGATLFSRKGAWFLAASCGASYGCLMILAASGISPGVEAAVTSNLSAGDSWMAWGVLMTALGFGVILAGRLSSELQSTGEALHASTRDLGRLHDLHDQIIESITSGLLTTDNRGRISSFNPKAERITGFSHNDVRGRPLDEIIPGAQALLGRGVGRKKKVRSRTRLKYRNASGTGLFLGVAASRLVAPDGQNRGHVVIFQDVSEVVGMEDELRNSERMAAVGEMAANIAHEIRNPLASIAGSIQLMVSSGALRQDSEETLRLTDIVLRETERLNGLITDFLQYSRPISPTFRELRLDHLVKEVMAMMEQSCPDTISLNLTSKEPVAAWADSEQLKKVLWNLAMNGIEAMPNGGELEFVIRQSEAAESSAFSKAGNGMWAEIGVRDSGPGVDQELEGRIFEPFFTTKVAGSGLGLATVHQAVQAHGGSVLVENTREGGALFTVRVPGIEAVA
ncbi:MAG: ATP-binding protein [Myxococcota bacterium]|nr:ATP-binding protein [Myxococcota bacterium]